MRHAQGQAARDLLERILWGVNVVQSGLDVSWDIFVSLGTIFLALSLMRHPAFGRIWSVVGGIIAAAALILNLATFPTAPDAAGWFDLGPAIGAWYGITLLLLLRHLPRLSGIPTWQEGSAGPSGGR